MHSPPRLGAIATSNGTQFRVWAPRAGLVTLDIEGGRSTPLATLDRVYHEVFLDDAGPGTRYRFRLDDGEPLPDPASRFQPEGVHGPSEVVDPAFAWTDESWTPPPLADLVFYELHVGTFTPAGTFAGARERLGYLRELGVTAVELMPVADFPGRWNWGYDHAALYAPSRAYGRPDDLRAFVDEAHRLGLAVFLDVIYNHLGPDGAYLPAFGPVFTDRHHTPWGQAVNLDDDGSRGVRDLFLDNVRYWFEEFHFDGLRLDATHALVDDSETHFLEELTQLAARMEPRRYLVAEDHRNLDKLLIEPPAGFGIDAVWADDLHHQIRNIIAGDAEGYYADFAESTVSDVAETLERGWFYDGRASRVTGKPRGTSAEKIRREQCVVCIQNHDQVGNRPAGDRLSHAVEPAAYRAASALLLFAPELPLLFQGQEWAASAPFQFFTDHNPDLGPLVSKGRKEEFKDFPGFSGDVPDPQDPDTFHRSKLDWDERQRGNHGLTLALYRALLALRPTLSGPFEARAVGEKALHVRRGEHHLLVAFAPATLPAPAGANLVLDTEDVDYAGDPQPATIRDGAVTLARPAAVILKA